MLLPDRTVESIINYYKEIYNLDQDSIRLRNRIVYLDRFIDAIKNNEKYSNGITEFIREIDRQSIEGNYFYFDKINIIQFVLRIIFDIKNMKWNYTEDNYYLAYKELGIFSEDDNIEELFTNQGLKEKVMTNIDQKDIEKAVPFLITHYLLNNDEIIEKSRNSALSNVEYIKYSTCIFVTIIETILIEKDYILEQYINREIDFDMFLNKIKQQYNSQINFKYIPSSVYRTNRFNPSIIYQIDNEDEQEHEEYKPESILNVIQKTENLQIKILGLAGAGKTTTLRYLENEDAVNYDKYKKIPILIELISVTKYNGEENIVQKLILKKLRLENNILSEEIVDYLLNKGRFNLYIDGVNEIKIKDLREKKDFLKNLEKELIEEKKYEHIRIIVSDRENNTQTIWSKKNNYTIQGLTEDDMKEFIRGNTNPDKEEEVEKKIFSEEVRRKYDFEQRPVQPILLKELITVIEQGEEVPTPRKLTERYIDTLIKREVVEKQEPIAQFIKEAIKYALKHIELPTGRIALIEQFNNFFSQDAIKRKVEDEKIEVKTNNFLKLAVRMGILKEIEGCYTLYNERMNSVFNNLSDILDS